VKEPIWTSRGEPAGPKLPCVKCANIVRLRVKGRDDRWLCMRCFTEEAGEGKFPTRVPPP